jgi:hypothetical protein
MHDFRNGAPGESPAGSRRYHNSLLHCSDGLARWHQGGGDGLGIPVQLWASSSTQPAAEAPGKCPLDWSLSPPQPCLSRYRSGKGCRNTASIPCGARCLSASLNDVHSRWLRQPEHNQNVVITMTPVRRAARAFKRINNQQTAMWEAFWRANRFPEQQADTTRPGQSA